MAAQALVIPATPRQTGDVLAAEAAGNRAHRDLSLYCHIPFCASVCHYRACNRVITANRERAAPYLAHLKDEIRRKAALIDTQRPVVEMHWGTPSRSPLERLMAHGWDCCAGWGSTG